MTNKEEKEFNNWLNEGSKKLAEGFLVKALEAEIKYLKELLEQQKK